MLLRNILNCIFVAAVFTSACTAKEQQTSISAIQGLNETSPLIDTVVSVEGVVTADFQDEKNFAGFFIQSNISGDHGQNESEGLFVYERQRKVQIGDLVRVKGKVTEHKGLTQLSNVKSLTVLKTGQKLPQPQPISLPLKGSNLESLEGMRVTLDQAGTITDHYNFIKHGEFTVSSQLLMTPTNSVPPGPMVEKIQQHNVDDQLLIDDGSFSSFVKHTKINSNTPVHIGAKVQVVGIMHYAFDQYRIQITEPIKFLALPKIQQSKPSNIKGAIKIAGFNVRNYFTTLDNGEIICGPRQDFSCRGADSAEEFIRQQAKLLQAISTANADVYAIQELENNDNSLRTLVEALNKKAKSNKWDYIKTGMLGDDVIRVGLIYKVQKLTPVGNYAVLDPTAMPDFEADKHRDVLLQTFKDVDNNLFNMAALHLKSKRCTDAMGADQDQQDGQGCYNNSRAKVAQQISDWLKKDPTNKNAPSTVIVGDFNAYLKEDPITVLEKNGYRNLAHDFLSAENWTSIYRGKVGSIDHIIVNKQAQESAKGMTQWHINSVTLGQLDYNLEPLSDTKSKPEQYFQLNPFASSDHDIVIAGFTFSNKD